MGSNGKGQSGEDIVIVQYEGVQMNWAQGKNS